MRYSNNLRIKELIQGYTSRTEWKENTEELYKKDLNDPDKHDSVVTHPGPDILECEVKWALGSTAVNTASGGNGIPVELFKTLKNDAIKMLHSICQQIWKTQQWPQDWKRSILIPVPKRVNTKECSYHRITALISHASKVMLWNLKMLFTKNCLNINTL